MHALHGNTARPPRYLRELQSSFDGDAYHLDIRNTRPTGARRGDNRPNYAGLQPASPNRHTRPHQMDEAEEWDEEERADDDIHWEPERNDIVRIRQENRHGSHLLQQELDIITKDASDDHQIIRLLTEIM